MEQPETRYTYIGDAAIAYQVMGGGPIDLVYVTGTLGNIETFVRSRAWLTSGSSTR